MARLMISGAVAVALLGLLVVVGVVDALRLPSYIKACQRSDPKLNECALKNGREAVAKFVNGDRKYKIPNLNPLTLYNFRVDSGGSAVGIKLNFKEAHIYGLGDANIKGIRLDLQRKHVEFDLLFPSFNILGDYEVAGRVIILPITGQGPANITVTNLDVLFTFDFELAPKKPGGKDHVSITNTAVKFKVGHAYFSFKNLFGGDKTLGDTMNVFLNENWDEVARELGPSLADAIGDVIRQIIQQIVDVVPYDNIFLP